MSRPRWSREPGTMPEEERLRRCASQKASMNRPHIRAVLSAKALASWADPEVRRRRSEARQRFEARKRAQKEAAE
jgi:hypothetical protein